jgi:hypothetical protein
MCPVQSVTYLSGRSIFLINSFDRVRGLGYGLGYETRMGEPHGTEYHQAYRYPDGRRFCPVILSPNGRIKPDWVEVDERQEKHPEGAYYLDWTEDGLRKRMAVGSDATAAYNSLKKKQSEFDAIARGLVVSDPCSTIEFQTDFQLLDLSKVALSGLGIPPRQLIDTTKAHYPATRSWAEQVYAAHPPIQGFLWSSRQDDRALAVVLFGSRVKASDLRDAKRFRPLIKNGVPEDFVIELATDLKVLLR